MFTYTNYVIRLCLNFSEKIICGKNDNISDFSLLFNTRDKNAYIFRIILTKKLLLIK